MKMLIPSLGKEVETSPNLRSKSVNPPNALKFKPTLSPLLTRADQCHLLSPELISPQKVLGELSNSYKGWFGGTSAEVAWDPAETGHLPQHLQ